MNNGTALPCTEGDSGAAKQICNRLAGNPSLVPGPMSMSASNVELVAAEAEYEDESEELAVLGSMEFEVLPADRLEKSKRYKPYDHPETKKGIEKTLPENASCPKYPQCYA